MGEEKRHEMMETLFGAESEDTDDEEVMERPAHPGSDDEVEGGGQVDAESEGERPGSELEREESEAERVESEAEREESDGDRSYDEEEQVKQQRGRPIAVVERRGSRQQVSVSGSEQSHEGGRALEEEEDEVEQFHKGHNVEEEEEEEVEQVHEQSDEGEDGKAADGVAEMRDVFGDSDEEEEQEPDEPRRAREEVSGSDEEASVQRGIRPEDIVPDTEQHEERYESDEGQPAEAHPREKPMGSPLQINVPSCPPTGPAEKMHIVRVSNIMGIESKAFDPKTYIEEEAHFVTDESGHKQRLRLEDNVVRWRIVRDRDGSRKYESNARFVKWSDGSVQLLIGNEVLDTSIQKAHQDQGHLFTRHGKGILQSQGRLLQKMKFMPSSLSSKSHRLLTALVDSRNRKIYKVKNVITNKDPEKEKEEAEKLHQKRIRSKEDLQRKQEKISRKYNPVRERAERQLSPGFLLREDGDADEVDEGEIQRQMEEESRAERRIMNAKRQSHSSSSRGPITITNRAKGRQYSPTRRDRYVEESENQPSEYETDEEEEARVDSDAREDEVEEEEEEEEEEEQAEEVEEEEYEDEHKGRASEDREDEPYKKRRGREDDSENERSPSRKPAQRRRVVVSESDED